MAMGVQCISDIKNAYEELQNSSSVKAVQTKLASLQEVGKALQKEAVRAKDALEEKEKELEQGLKVLTVKKTELENEVTGLIDDKASAEARCRTLNTQLSDKKDDYEEARRDLSAAENRLQEVKKEADTASNIGLVVGIIFFGPILGGLAGRGIASLINDSEAKTESTKNRLSNREGDVQRVKIDLRDIEKSISRIQQRIDDIQSNIKSCNAEINSTHDKMTATKKSISIHLEAAHLWELFETAAENATGFTERLKNIVTKATKPEKMHILKSNGVIIKVTSFMEAWQEISTQGQILGTYIN